MPQKSLGRAQYFPSYFFLSLKYFSSFLSAYVYPHCTMYVLLCIHAPQSMSSSDRRSKKRGDFQKLWQGEEQRKKKKGGKEKKLRRAFFCHRESLMSLFFSLSSSPCIVVLFPSWDPCTTYLPLFFPLSIQKSSLGHNRKQQHFSPPPSFSVFNLYFSILQAFSSFPLPLSLRPTAKSAY